MRNLVKVLLLVIAALGLVYLSAFLGLIELPAAFKNLPGLNKNSAVKTVTSNQASPSEDVRTLKYRVKELEKEIEQYKQQVEVLEKENQKLQTQLKLSRENTSGVQSGSGQQSTQPDKYRVMAETYSNMKKAKAAEILSRLDDETIIGILKQMKSDTAAGILSEMDPNRAAVLTNKMLQ